MVDEDGVPNTVPIHRVTSDFWPKSSRYTSEPGSAQQSDSPQGMGDTLRQTNDRAMEEIISMANPDKVRRGGSSRQQWPRPRTAIFCLMVQK